MNLPDFFLKPGTNEADPRKLVAVAVPILLLIAIALALVFTGGDSPAPTTTSTVAAAPTSTTSAPTSTTSTTLAPPTWPLSGAPADADALETTPVLIAKVDNTRNSRPQLGLDAADLVIEVVVEGGVPRLLAFFQSQIPPEIGPIRSAREVDPKLIEPFGALMAHSGGRSHVLQAVGEVATDVGHPGLGDAAYYREPTRPGTYDLMLRTADVLDRTPPEEPSTDWLVFGEAPAGEQALSVELSQSSANTVNYRYSSADGGYLRFFGERPHEAEDAGQLVAANVVVLYVEQIDTGRTDSAGSAVPDYEVVGQGDAVVFRDGVAIPGRWERAAQSEFFRFVDESGSEIPLAVGTTWIELTPLGRPLDWQ